MTASKGRRIRARLVEVGLPKEDPALGPREAARARPRRAPLLGSVPAPSHPTAATTRRADHSRSPSARLDRKRETRDVGAQLLRGPRVLPNVLAVRFLAKRPQERRVEQEKKGIVPVLAHALRLGGRLLRSGLAQMLNADGEPENACRHRNDPAPVPRLAETDDQEHGARDGRHQRESSMILRSPDRRHSRCPRSLSGLRPLTVT